MEPAGLCSPCGQLDGFRHGLMQPTLERGADGGLVRKSGLMAIVVVGGEIGPGDAIAIERPPGEGQPLEPV